nr:hypothetical protein [uncultured Blautia sp.]
MITVDNPVSKVYSIWSAAVENKVGKGNYSMSQSGTLASNKTKYARIFMMGNPTRDGDLEGDECSTIPAFQVDSFAKGTKALSEVYAIDDVSHKAMVGMGFRRSYGPELLENSDSTIKRVVSRYSRVYTGQLLGEKVSS